MHSTHRKFTADAAQLHITDTSRLLTVLKRDTKAIFTAASQATRAVDYLYGLQPTIDPIRDPVTAKSGNDPARPADDAVEPSFGLAGDPQ